MNRMTIRDLATAAGVSVATVNRVLSGSGTVKPDTMKRVMEAAQRTGFYGLGAIQHRVAKAGAGAGRRLRFGVIMQTAHRQFSAVMQAGLEQAVEALRVHGSGPEITLHYDHLDDFSPESFADRLLALARQVDAIAVTAAEHPIVTDAIDSVVASGVPVLALASPLAARSAIGYVGLDWWKVGRTSAWYFEHLCKHPGKLGVLVGTPRYRSHDLNESGFRSYFREHGPDFLLLEPQSSFESDGIARELTERMLRSHPDLCGLYIACGGNAGALAAIREGGFSGRVVTLGFDLVESSRTGLLNGSLTLMISHSFAALSRETIDALLRLHDAEPPARAPSALTPFEIYTRENL